MKSVQLGHFTFRAIKRPRRKGITTVNMDTMLYREGDDTLTGRKLTLRERFAALFGAKVCIALRGDA